MHGCFITKYSAKHVYPWVSPQFFQGGAAKIFACTRVFKSTAVGHVEAEIAPHIKIIFIFGIDI
jgi:hypothetical protein